MIPEHEVNAFRAYILATPPDQLPCPRNWPPRSGGAFDANPPWARFRGGSDQAPVYPTETGMATGAELHQKIVDGMKLHGGTMQLSDDEISELERALMPPAGNGSKPIDPYADPAFRQKVSDHMRERGVSNDETAEMFRRWDEMPRNATEGGFGGALSMATDAELERLYPGITRIVPEEPRRDPPRQPYESEATRREFERMFPDAARIVVM
jgi:hypothetical protein